MRLIQKGRVGERGAKKRNAVKGAKFKGKRLYENVVGLYKGGFDLQPSLGSWLRHEGIGKRGISASRKTWCSKKRGRAKPIA